MYEEEIWKKLMNSLGTPKEYFESTTFTPPSSANIYLEMFKKMAAQKLEEADKALLEKVNALTKEVEKLVKSKNRKYRSIDDPFEPSIGEN